MKRIQLCAYTEQNLGDDLFIHTITKRYPKVKFHIWTDPKNKPVFKSLPNLKVLVHDSLFAHFPQYLRIRLAARYRNMLDKRCDAVIFIGGSIFMEYPNWEQLCTWWEWTAKNRPFFVLGANFGPYHTEAYRDKMADIFSDCIDVCFRDLYSAELFKDVPTVRQAPDILFTYPMPKPELKHKQVFFSVIDCPSRGKIHDLFDYDEQYVRNMSVLIQNYLDTGHTVVLSSFCKTEGDEKGIEKILNFMGVHDHPGIRILNYNGTNSDEIVTSIAESEMVVATRFHATILALSAGRPVLPIIYSDKTAHVLNDLGYKGITVDIRKNNWVTFTEAEQNKNIETPVDILKEKAQQHFAVLEQRIK